MIINLILTHFYIKLPAQIKSLNFKDGCLPIRKYSFNPAFFAKAESSLKSKLNAIHTLHLAKLFVKSVNQKNAFPTTFE